MIKFQTRRHVILGLTEAKQRHHLDNLGCGFGGVETFWFRSAVIYLYEYWKMLLAQMPSFSPHIYRVGNAKELARAFFFCSALV